MGYEIERKFLVDTQKLNLQDAAGRQKMRQGYLLNETGKNVRIRISGDHAYLTVKGKGQGIRRLEFEYEIPVNDALEMLALTDGKAIEKTRYFFEVGGHVWEVDVFEGDNAGLVVAEIELADENEAFELPGWAKKEVSGDPRYLNARLLVEPYKNWTT